MAVRAEHAVDMRQRIMRAAERVFAQKGFAGASISDLCSEASVNRALIYYYFDDKEALYQAVLADGDASMMQIAEHALSTHGTALDKLRHFLKHFAQMFLERQSLVRVVMRREFTLTSDLSGEDRYSGPQAVMAQIVREGISTGELRNLDPERTAHFLTGAIFSLVFMHVTCPERLPDENIEYAMQVLTHGIAEPTPVCPLSTPTCI